MPFLQLILTVGEADPSPFEDALLRAGALSITLEDAADDPVLEPAPGATPLWPRVRIKALFDGATAPDDVIAALDAQLPHPLPPSTFEVLADRAWEREWLKDFRPMKFGRRLWICPGGQWPSLDDAGLSRHAPSPLALSRETGEGAAPAHPCASRHSDSCPSELAEAACFLELDPGLAFGTGTHPTTALCLEWLDGAQLEGKRVIDYGCGSGVLAIAALKLGAAHALALDIDHQALIATRDNAERNGVADRLTVELVTDAPLAPVDIVIANILAGPLEQLAPTLAALVCEGGRLVLSGILREQAPAVAARYAAWFDIAPPIGREDWTRLDGVRRAC